MTAIACFHAYLHTQQKRYQSWDWPRLHIPGTTMVVLQCIKPLSEDLIVCHSHTVNASCAACALQVPPCVPQRTAAACTCLVVMTAAGR